MWISPGVTSIPGQCLRLFSTEPISLVVDQHLNIHSQQSQTAATEKGHSELRPSMGKDFIVLHTSYVKKPSCRLPLFLLLFSLPSGEKPRACPIVEGEHFCENELFCGTQINTPQHRTLHTSLAVLQRHKLVCFPD